MPSVTVNLDINVNAQTDVEVFGQTPTPPIENIVIADIKLPVNVFYNNEFDCLIYFQGQGDNIVGSKGNFTTTEEQISNAINNVLNNTLDGYQAYPFNESQYYILPYTQYNNFGELALASYSHSLTGHVAATAAITNDSEIISYFTGNTSGSAQIAAAIANQIYNMDTTKCTNIVKQVLGQDASRTIGRDNDDTNPNSVQGLEFKNGDIIYFGITLQKPTSINTGTGQAYSISNTLFTDITYYIKVTLGDLSQSGTGRWVPTNQYGRALSDNKTFISQSQNIVSYDYSIPHYFGSQLSFTMNTATYLKIELLDTTNSSIASFIYDSVSAPDHFELRSASNPNNVVVVQQSILSGSAIRLESDIKEGAFLFGVDSVYLGDVFIQPSSFYKWRITIGNATAPSSYSFDILSVFDKQPVIEPVPTLVPETTVYALTWNQIGIIPFTRLPRSAINYFYSLQPRLYIFASGIYQETTINNSTYINGTFTGKYYNITQVLVESTDLAYLNSIKATFESLSSKVNITIAPV